jgi:hypothetical protein
MSDQEIETDGRDCLSDSHRDYMQRYVEHELSEAGAGIQELPPRAI